MRTATPSPPWLSDAQETSPGTDSLLPAVGYAEGVAPTRQIVKSAVLLGSVIVLATTSAIAGRWDPTYEDEPTAKIDLHALTLDDREIVRTPSDPSSPLFLPGDVPDP